jgi:diguanylate cyclase (GGDEF)-like protein
MTVAGKINVLFLSAALVLALVLTGFTAYREYHIALERSLDASLAKLQANPDLQVAIYRRDVGRLQALLTEFLEIPAVASAIARDGLAELLAREEGSIYSVEVPPPFEMLRGDLSTADTGLTTFDSKMQPVEIGLWAALTGSDSPIYLTVPVFTAVNPAQLGLEAYDFFVAPLDPDAKNSRRVIGYIQLEISSDALLEDIWPAVGSLLYVSLLLVAICGVVIALVTRRITRDLSQLALLADEVASGKLEKPVEINSSGEIRDIANVLNSVIGGFTDFKKETDVGKRLLSMKVDERTSQLSKRDEALNRAEEEVFETRTRLERVSYYDNLTALPNRRLFSEQLQLLLSLNQRNGLTLALLFLNLDNFKRINDSLGHSAGDQVLVEITKRLVDGVRGSDSVGHYVKAERKIDVSRIGGDEFTVVLNQVEDFESAGRVAERLLHALEEPMTIEGHELVVSPSIGIAIAPRDGESVEALLKAAGIAMHHAKESVREKVLFYSEHMDASGVGRLKLESDLRRAVERGELVLHYQPQVNTLTGAITGAEALLRWEHPEHGEVPPFQFISLAEEIGVISELGDWVMAEACRQIEEFDAMGLELPRIAINISIFQFTAGFPDRVREILEKFGLPASRLELGLSETILMDEDRTAIENLRELRKLGVYLSVDDFGTRLAPLTYLNRRTLDELKIDRSFIAECDTDKNRAGLVKAIIAMARSLEMGIVAEGVETEGQYRFLIDNGADVMQGYLFSKPMPAAELQAVLAPWHFVQQLQELQG